MLWYEWNKPKAMSLDPKLRKELSTVGSPNFSFSSGEGYGWKGGIWKKFLSKKIPIFTSKSTLKNWRASVVKKNFFLVRDFPWKALQFFPALSQTSPFRLQKGSVQCEPVTKTLRTMLTLEANIVTSGESGDYIV